MTMRWQRPMFLAAALLLWQLAAFSQASTPTSVADAPSAEQSGQQSSDSAATQQTTEDQDSQPGDSPFMFEHPATARYWLSGQSNIISQYHPSFPAKYSGVNSMLPIAQHATSRVFTLYTGYEVGQHTEVILDVESAGGHGLSEGAGLGGFTDLDIVRTPNLGQAPYLARLMIHTVIPLSSETTESERSFLSLSSELPVRRIEIRFGKFSMVDFFDVNSVGSDSHLQFMNWTDDNNGAYDYAANTRGYTWGAMVEYDDRRWSARFAETLMPKVANGENLDADIARARAENMEVEFRRQFLPHRDGKLRLLSYVNHADMGSYREAIDEFLAHLTPAPNIVATRLQGRIKYGFGANAEQALGHGFRAFARWGWNNGRTESFAYTEVDQTITAGADLEGDAWHRRLDKIGAAFILNAISGDHREYLRLGGTGFLLGDGGLNYGRERIFEGYYTVHLWRGVFASADLQHVTNPGYNRDRGPVLVPSMRLHVDF
ncbi:MAG TPA: carbohydrate porin [Terriglobia bacterium]|nr:carbohydrate porin [Terriglobia bacterium]